MKKLIIILSAVLLGLALLTGAVLWGMSAYHEANYITIGQKEYYLGETQLDLSNQGYPDVESILKMENLHRLDLRGTKVSTQDYQTLRSALPQCNILWDIPFQGNYYDPSTSHFTVTQLAGEDITQLAYFENLRVVDASNCTDYPEIMMLQEQYPNCQVKYFVEVDGQRRSKNTTTLSIADPDMEEVELALTYLCNMKTLTFSGKLPAPKKLLALREQFPHVDIHWEYVLMDKVLTDDITRLDLSGVIMDSPQAVENALPYLPELTWVDMSDCGISNEEMDALNKRHENVRFVWTIYAGRCRLRTDVTTFMPYLFGYDAGRRFSDKDAENLKYCTDIICMDMGHMGITECSFLYYMPNMQYLLLADTELKDYTPIGSLKELKYLELFIAKDSDVSPLARCEKLEDINLCYTFIDNLNVLKDLPNLKNLWLIGAHYNPNHLVELQEARPDVNICITGSSSTGSGWRELPNYYAQRDALGMYYMKG